MAFQDRIRKPEYGGVTRMDNSRILSAFVVLQENRTEMYINRADAAYGHTPRLTEANRFPTVEDAKHFWKVYLDRPFSPGYKAIVVTETLTLEIGAGADLS